MQREPFRFWHNPCFRQLVYQSLVLLAVLLMLWSFAQNASRNLQEQGIASGFSFLLDKSGFAIIQSLIPYSEDASYGRAFLVGLFNTFLVSGLGILLATIAGFAIGIARLSTNWLIAQLATFYVETLRNIPLLLLIFFWYFVVLRSLPHPRASFQFMDSFFLNNRGLYLPSLPGGEIFLLVSMIASPMLVYLSIRAYARRYKEKTGQTLPMLGLSLALLVGIPLLVLALYAPTFTLERPVLRGFNFSGGFVLIPEFVALLVALSTYTAAFIAETVRAGIQAVDRGQKEAAYSLGLSRSQTLRFIIVPQAFRVIVPPLTSQYLNLTKNSSLAAAIGYPDLVSVFAGTVLNQTGQAVEVIIITMSVYLSISLLISLAMNLFNKRIALKGLKSS